jgi:hypothetical protein
MRWEFAQWRQARSMVHRLVWEGYPWWKVVLKRRGRGFEVSVRNWSVVQAR